MNAMTAISTRKEKGFTLIELVMVIVILGILAAFALPRFADLSGDAEVASIEGARGSVKSAMGIVRSAALARGVEGVTGTPETLSLEGTDNINVVYGYLAASSLEDAAQLSDFNIPASGTTRFVTIDPAAEGKPCFNFTESDAENSPSTVTELGVMNADADACTV